MVMNKKIFGQYIRSLREQRNAEQFGFKSLSKRRTPGLRREELAQLCEVSPIWITLLEQGRGTHPSKKLLHKMVQVLKLTRAETDHLFQLSEMIFLESNPLVSSQKIHFSAELEHYTNPRSALLLNLVNTIDSPAYVLNANWDLLCWNSFTAELFSPWLADKVCFSFAANLLDYLLLNEEAKQHIIDWPARAERAVAEFRADSTMLNDYLDIQQHIDELMLRSKEFKHFWQMNRVLERDGGLKQFHHPELGKVTYQQVASSLSGFDDLKLVILLRV